MKINKKAVGQRIKDIRLNKGMTLEEFGKLFGAEKSIIYYWENGTALPNKERLKTLCKVADISLNDLLYGTNQEKELQNYKSFYEYIKAITMNGNLSENLVREKIKEIEKEI